MAYLSISKYFITLSILAVALLWGVGAWNGSMDNLMQSVLLGRYEDGTPLRTNYTGFLPVDFPLTVLVGFFDKGTNGSDQEAQLFIFDVMANVQPALVWFAMDNARLGTDTSSIWMPFAWGMLCNIFGAGVIFPIYFMFMLKREEKFSGKTQIHTSRVPKAILGSYLLGGVLPWFLVGTATSVARRASVHQQLLAIFQLSPLWFSIFQIAGSSFSERVISDRRPMTAQFWTGASYLITALPSAVAHLHVLNIALRRSKALSLSRMYIPYFATGPIGTSLDLGGPWLFLQYDNIMIALSSISWAYIFLSRSHGPGNGVLLLLGLVVGTLVIGSGATVSIALYMREKMAAKEEKKRL